MNGKKAVTYTRYKKKEKKTNNRKNNKRVLLAKKMYVAQCLYIKLYVSKPIVANIKKKQVKKMFCIEPCIYDIPMCMFIVWIRGQKVNK